MKYFHVLTLILASPCLLAQTETPRSKHFNIDDKLAIEGYDPVSYFQNSPVEGSSSRKFEYKGVIYYFASAENLALFKANPDKYEPAYGGWCAFAMGDSGEKVKVDPETYKIIDGKVYLFYNFWGNNTLKSWNKDEASLKSKADQNWGKLFR
jgi:YHS domain-containing protein